MPSGFFRSESGSGACPDGVRVYTVPMKTATATLNGDKAETTSSLTVIKAAMKELSAIRKANKTTDAEIRRLKTSTRQTLRRIEENLRHVEAHR